MPGAWQISNATAEPLEIWVEPWCHPYYVPPGATLKLTWEASAGPLEAELTPERLVVWPNSDREPDAELDGRRIAPDFRAPAEAAPEMGHGLFREKVRVPASSSCRASRLPPPAVWAVAAAFLLLVPLAQWTEIGLREWRDGGSPAAALEAPYFWAVLALRTGGAVALGLLLLMLRRPAVPWVAIAAAWLAGPPLTFLAAGIGQLAGSAGQRALPANWTFLAPAVAFALLVTALLLGSRRAREHYRAARDF